jgi:hypothetical protein
VDADTEPDGLDGPVLPDDLVDGRQIRRADEVEGRWVAAPSQLVGRKRADHRATSLPGRVDVPTGVGGRPVRGSS